MLGPLTKKVICLAVALPSLVHYFRAQEALREYLEQSPHCLDVNPRTQEGQGWPRSQEVLVAELDLELPGVP